MYTKIALKKRSTKSHFFVQFPWYYYILIVVNPRNHRVKSAIFKDPVGDFHNFGFCNFFLVLL